MTMQKQIESIHRQMTRAAEAEHLLILNGDGEPVAVPMRRVVGIYRAPRFEELAEDVAHAIANENQPQEHQPR